MINHSYAELGRRPRGVQRHLGLHPGTCAQQRLTTRTYKRYGSQREFGATFFLRGENTTRAFRMCFYPPPTHSVHIRTATVDGDSCVCVVTCHRPVSDPEAGGRQALLLGVCLLRCAASLPSCSLSSFTDKRHLSNAGWILLFFFFFFLAETVRGSVRRFPPPRQPYLVFQCVGNSPVPVRSRGGDRPLSCCCC